MMMRTSTPPYYSPPNSSHNETISVSIELGTDRSTSILLPRGHNVVKHLEQLLPAIAAAPPSQQQNHHLQPFPFANQSDMEKAVAVERLDNGRSRFSLPIHQLPQLQTYQAPRISSLSQYIHANSRYETTSTKQVPTRRSTTLLTNRSVPVFGNNSTNDDGLVYDHTQEYLTPAPPRRRSACSKRCRVLSCNKIPVSRGLCRGHGGGRRCQHVDCAKGAQSRSNFCWAHGGGHRCHVKGCMRSRKSKHYCVAHLDRESPAAISTAPAYPVHGTYKAQRVLPAVFEVVPPADFAAQTKCPRLPSLVQALRKTRQSVATRQRYATEG